MGKKPVSIVVIGVVFLLAPLLNIAQALYFTRLPLFGDLGLFTQFNYHDWAVLVMFPVIGIGVLRVKPWGWFLFTVFTAFLIVFNTVSFLTTRIYSFAMVVHFNLVLALLAAVFFRKHLRAPYFDPRLRWWESDPRYAADLVARVSIDGGHRAARIADISRTGLSLTGIEGLSEGQGVSLEIQGFGRRIPCSGRVMRIAPLPEGGEGCGLMFHKLDRATRAALKSLVAELVRRGAAERGRPRDWPGSAAPFGKKLAWCGKALWRELLPTRHL